jgi:hypothetical protein
MSILLGLLTQFWPYIVGAIGLGWAALKLRQSGANAERAKQAAAEAKARDVADQVDNDLGTLTPAQKRKELGEWSPD